MAIGPKSVLEYGASLCDMETYRTFEPSALKSKGFLEAWPFLFAFSLAIQLHIFIYVSCPLRLACPSALWWLRLLTVLWYRRRGSSLDFIVCHQINAVIRRDSPTDRALWRTKTESFCRRAPDFSHSPYV